MLIYTACPNTVCIPHDASVIGPDAVLAVPVSKERRGKVVDVRTTDVETGEISGEFRAIHVRVPKSPFESDFLMAAQKPLKALFKRRHEIGSECMWVLILLLSDLDFHNLVQVSPSVIARENGMHRQNVARAIRKLVEIGVLVEGAKVGVYRSYRLNPEFGWKGSVVDHHIALRARMKAARIEGVVSDDHPSASG